MEKSMVKCRGRTFAGALARWISKIVLAILLVVATYAIIGTVFSILPVNRHPAFGDDVVAYLVDNGIHTDVIVPTVTERIDWSKVVPPGDTSSGVQKNYVAFGWGSQDFYLNVPEWRDLTPGIALRAISGTGGTALHTRYANEPRGGADCRRLMLSTVQYDALVKYILASGKRTDAGTFVRIPHAGYGWNDAFYEGLGRYSPFFTCNTWANSALKACGQKCCLWTAFSAPIFWKYPLGMSGP